MHRKEVTHSSGSYERKSRGWKLADEMGRAKKIPMVHSWTDAPEESDLWTAWQLFPLDDDQTWDFKDRVDVELLYNSVKTEEDSSGCSSSWSRSYRRDVVGKATSGRRGLGNPDGVWGPEKLLIRCSRSPSRVGPGPPVEHQENEKDATLTAISLGSKYCSYVRSLNSLSQANIE